MCVRDMYSVMTLYSGQLNVLLMPDLLRIEMFNKDNKNKDLTDQDLSGSL